MEIQLKHTINFLLATLCIMYVSTSLTFAQNKGNWVNQEFFGDNPSERYANGLVKLKDKFVLIGGRGRQPVQIYHPNTQTWVNTKAFTDDIHSFQAVVFSNKVYIIGALTGTFPNETPVPHVLIFDPVKDEVTQGAEIPAERLRGATGAWTHNSKIYMVGGNLRGNHALLEDSSTAHVAWFDEYNPATNTWTSLSDAPHARDHLKIIVRSNKLYVLGGRRSSQDIPEVGKWGDTEAALDIYDFNTQTWINGDSTGNFMPTPRSELSIAYLGNEIVTMGGVAAQDSLSASFKVEAYSLSNNKWRALNPPPVPRRGTQAIRFKGNAYIIGGSTNLGDSSISINEDNFIEIFSINRPIPSPPTWKRLAQAQSARVEGPGILYQDQFYIFNGFNTGLSIENSVTRYDPATDTWTNLSPMPLQENGDPWACTHNGFAIVGDTVWIAGGRVGSHPGKVTDRVWWYIISQDIWLDGPTLPVPAAGGGLARVGRKLHYVGGFDATARCDVNYHLVYDLDNPVAAWQDFTDRSPMPEERNHFGTAVLGGKIYTIGGQNGHDPGCVARPGRDNAIVHVYDPVSDTWTRIADYPWRDSHMEPGTFATDGKIFVVGGQLQGDRVVSYDPATDTWTELTDFQLPDPVLAPVARILGEQMYVLTGGAPEAIFPVTNAWVKAKARDTSALLSFNPQKLEISLRDDEIKTIETILYTYNGIADYAIDISTLPIWLRLNKNQGQADGSKEEIELSLNADILDTAGVYTYTLIARAPGYTDATIDITFEVNKTGIPTCGDLPDNWQSQDIGIVGFPGRSCFQDSLFVLEASGEDILEEADGFHFAFQEINCQEADMIVRLDSIQLTDPGAKAGLMIRESRQAGARNIAMLIRAESGAIFQYRQQRDENSFFIETPGEVGNYLRLRRQGNLFEGFIADSLGNWQKVGEILMDLPNQILIGLALTANNNSTKTQAAFSEFQLDCIPACEALTGVWSNEDIGMPALTGDACLRGDVFEVQAAGRDIYGNEDEFHFVSQSLNCLKGEITARIKSFDAQHPWAKAGIMIRENKQANAKYAMMTLTKERGVRFMARTTPGGSTRLSNPLQTTDQTLRLVRDGDFFYGYILDTLGNWQLISTLKIIMDAEVSIGLALTAHDTSQIAQASFDQVNITCENTACPTLLEGWQSQDIGAVELSGQACFEDDLFRIQASGKNIMGNEDQFHFVYQAWNCQEGEIIAKLEGFSNSSNRARAGLMIREDTTAQSKNVAVLLQPTGRARFQYRPEIGGNTQSTILDNQTSTFLRLVRRGNTFIGYLLDSSNTWQAIDSVALEMSTQAYVGIAASSVQSNGIVEVQLGNVTDICITAGSIPSPDSTSVQNSLTELYPNPLESEDTQIHLSFEQVPSGVLQFILADELGSIQFQKVISEADKKSYLLDLGAVKPGTYILNIVGENIPLVTRRIVIQ